MAKKEIDRIVLNQPGFYGEVIEEFPYKVFIEKANSEDLDLPFETDGEVFFAYYHFYGKDLRTHIFESIEKAKGFASRLSKDLRICKDRGKRQNPKKHGFQVEQTRYEDVFKFEECKNIRLIVEKIYKNLSYINCFDKVSHEQCFTTIVFNSKYSSEDALNYAYFMLYPYCIRYMAKDREKRKYGIIYKDYPDFNMYISYVDELILVNELNEEKQIVMSFAYDSMFDAEEKAENEIKEIKTRQSKA